MNAKELGAQAAAGGAWDVIATNPGSGLTRTLERREKGLTKRELFAAMAMQGLLSNPSLENTEPQRNGIEVTAEAARMLADALLAELAKDQP